MVKIKEVIFEEKMKPWSVYLGIAYACWCSFGGVLFFLMLSTVSGDINYDIINIFTGIIFPLTIFLVYIPTIIKPLKKQKISKIILWFLIGVVVIFITEIICRFTENNLMAYLGYNIKNFNSVQLTQRTQDTNMFKRIYSIISLILIGPFCEEATYRVCLFGTLRQKFKKNYRILAHLITALLFGFQHISAAVICFHRYQEFFYITSYIGFSLVTTFLYEKTKTPVPGILAHIALNLFFII